MRQFPNTRHDHSLRMALCGFFQFGQTFQRLRIFKIFPCVVRIKWRPMIRLGQIRKSVPQSSEVTRIIYGVHPVVWRVINRGNGLNPVHCWLYNPIVIKDWFDRRDCQNQGCDNANFPCCQLSIEMKFSEIMCH